MMKKEQEKIKEELKNWIEENMPQLSPNAGTWHIEVYENTADAEPQEPIKLGRYDAEVPSSNPFYKPYSKMFVLPL
ncbi:hypothetical protein [Chryseobacterium kwangjuense]|uniref:Uncharacterized protein n=1 Tax=Chryseobacterium kwangjuense TaxID=267125 RepID=A0A135WI67_9FLAO|nr:hypothetical protein [Chryseobacterium kwangjuense]KXH84614.1 hypothetical protein AU378_02300 [Chryseobacterium kwangjuense]